jgi:hypothetical protein
MLAAASAKADGDNCAETAWDAVSAPATDEIWVGRGVGLEAWTGTGGGAVAVAVVAEASCA